MFNPPRGLRDGFTTDTLEKDIRNRSQDKQIQEGFKAANAVGGKGGLQGLSERYDSISKLNIMCSKVTVPERTFDVGLYRHYGPAFAYPKGVQYGTLTTTFYADGVMQIKSFLTNGKILSIIQCLVISITIMNIHLVSIYSI